MIKKNLILTLVVLIFGSLFTFGCSSKDQVSSISEKEVITITDVVGREVELKAPVDKVVLANGRFIQEFAAIEGEDFATKVVGIGSDLLKFDKDIYDKYTEKFPEMKNIADIGHFSDGTFNVEKVISLKPDVVIIQSWFVKTAADAISTLENAGIPVVVIDFSINPIEGPPQSILLMGKIMGKEKRAADIADYFNKQVEIVFSRLEKIEKSKPTVYIENGGRGPSEYGKTYGNIGWGKMVKLAGGINIAENIVKNMGDIAPEYLLNENPDNIIIAGYSSERAPNALKFGYHIKNEEALSLLKGHLNRSGWDSLSAVKNKKVYGVSMGHSIQIYNFVPLQAFAKWFYPEEFKDIDPEKNLKEFHEKFAVVEYSGTWMTSIE